MQIPSGATHVSEGNAYYKLSGKFWFVFNEQEHCWIAISGDPSFKVVEITRE